ncbi:hypothetical protein [Paraglaciecola marina]|uniref:hypothetical protein n=1 Tax=Paraglaciecola marina TaxID=2500157 RepID=UPI00106051A7|nr:hypothetical protein [Paraglaciecola marina]
MKQNFNHQVHGVSPEQTRLALSGKTMVEQEQPVPVLKPSLRLSQEVDNQTHKERLKQEQQRVTRYQIRVTETHSTYRMNGQVIKTTVDRQVQHLNNTQQLANDFNMESAQAHDQKQLSISY